ncbi:alanine racemase domain protein [Coriobacterium glomerans PW2]|uniref:Pyridoxal phosphate homeostasis protein n=1 Tax=Coriobacterium glomerans (strain ATCC 49209 / DSM 20642 / JCM 10262 / PW2) TaxID=700015 RepID=F2NBS8_CORGP|nr:YggS family pyridoxal phosphate-dependent enzyme [Coriobacterium glomerans]AEB06887.1 alanine racemase domain protein [Coriobacterium glomerans PW2]
MDEYEDALRERRYAILSRMDRALQRSGRPRKAAQLMAVSKTVDPVKVEAAIRVGYRVFGENRPQELVRKMNALAPRQELPQVRFDMIGNLQKNKINAVLGRAAYIQSISSESIARAVSVRVEREIAARHMIEPQPVLLEVNVSGETSKAGFAPEELRASMDRLRSLCGIRIAGMMTMAPRAQPTLARATFRGLRELRDELVKAYDGLDLSVLSCGMSEDFEIALEEGATLIRLGRVVFDPSFELE